MNDLPKNYQNIDTFIEQGKAFEAFQATRSLNDAIENWGNLGAELTRKALDRNMAETAYELFLKGYSGSITLKDLLFFAAEVDDIDALEFFAPKCNGPMLRSAAFYSFQENGPSSSFAPLAMSLAKDLDTLQWEELSSKGLCNFWQRRQRHHYERACDRLGVPVWSSSRAAPVQTLRANFYSPWACSWSQREFNSLSLPQETLLWSGVEFSFWRKEMQEYPSLPWAYGVFDDFEASYYEVVKHMPSLTSSILKAKQTKNPQPLEKDVAHLSRIGAGRWIPFILAFSNELPFEESDNLSLGPLIHLCDIDKYNVGMIAASWHEQSQHPDPSQRQPKLARTVLAALGLGRVSDDALDVLAARVTDLQSDSLAWLAISSNVSEDLMRCSKTIIASHQASLKLKKSASQ